MGTFMKWTVEYTEKLKYVRVNIKDEFNVQEHLKMIEDIVSQKFWCPGMPILFDGRAVYLGNTDFNTVMQASRNQILYDEQLGNGKNALLMKSAADFGIGRQYEMITEEKISAKIHVFLDEQQAIRWLIT